MFIVAHTEWLLSTGKINLLATKPYINVMFDAKALIKWGKVSSVITRGVLEGVAGVAMATPVGTQNIKKEIKRKKEREREKKKEREKEREKERKGNVFFIVLIQIYIN